MCYGYATAVVLSQIFCYCHVGSMSVIAHFLDSSESADNRKGQCKSLIQPIIPSADPGTSDSGLWQTNRRSHIKDTGTRTGSSLIQCRAHPELSVSALIFHLVSHPLCPSAPLPFFFSPLNVVCRPSLSSHSSVLSASSTKGY